MTRARLFWLALALANLAAFDHAMRADEARLCASDLTWTQGCGE